MADEAREWSVAKAVLASGKVLVINFRSREPSGVERAAFRTRVIVRWPYADRGDGLPDAEQLAVLQKREVELESANAVRLVSKTGDGRREAVFQVVDRATFLERVGDATSDAADDPAWGFWQSTIAKFTGLETGLIGIQKDLSESVVELLTELQLGATRGAEISGAEALAGRYLGTAVAVVGGWTIVLSPQFYAGPGTHRADRLFCDAVHYELVKRSRQSLVLGALVSRALSMNGFVVYRGGLLRRTWLDDRGTVAMSDGDETPEESAPNAEERVLSVLRRSALPFDALNEARFSVYRS